MDGGASVIVGGTSVAGVTSVVGCGTSVVGGGISVVGGGTSVVGGATSVMGTDVNVSVGTGTGVLVRVRVGLGVLVITVGTGEDVLVSTGINVIVLVGGGWDVFVRVGKRVWVLVTKKNPSPGRRVLVSEIEVRDAITGGRNEAVVVIVSVGLTVGELEGNAVKAGKTPENASTVSAWAVFTLAMASSTMPRDCSAADADEFVSAKPILAAMHSSAIPKPPAPTTHKSWTYWVRCVSGAAFICLCT